ncbi:MULTISPECIES: hypothetical protein [Pseudomonas]|uniref:Cytochrome oxidase complex assembly protein 1 n=1 Tax=Pseudomonas quercus TaxID=2722792 RepID=A0ABX0YBH4_9PSED|nr:MULTISPECIES: hypothetical protein [Pseudomonas]MBF7142182.1 hypothetical protein [Pseudomonas sp. LY10J]NJP00720.1 hypothetical protein [Pseudomonas quercus]
MRGSDTNDGQHSNAEVLPPRSSYWLRFLGSLAIFGMLVGLMVGKLMDPGRSAFERVELLPAGEMNVWFDHAPQVHGEIVDGAVAILFDASGPPVQGQLELGGRQAKWTLRHTDKGLLLTVIAARPLQAKWEGEEASDGWRLHVSLRDE